MTVNVLTSSNICLGKTDHLIVAANRTPRLDVVRRHLVAIRNHVAHRHAFVGNDVARNQLLRRYQHIVIDMQADYGRLGHVLLQRNGFTTANTAATKGSAEITTRTRIKERVFAVPAVIKCFFDYSSLIAALTPTV